MGLFRLGHLTKVWLRVFFVDQLTKIRWLRIFFFLIIQQKCGLGFFFLIVHTVSSWNYFSLVFFLISLLQTFDFAYRQSVSIGSLRHLETTHASYLIFELSLLCKIYSRTSCLILFLNLTILHITMRWKSTKLC